MIQQSSRPVNILLVEEDELLTGEIISSLNESGYNVITASRAATVGQLIQKWLPEVILFNVKLTVKEGWQAISRLNKRAAVPLIALVTIDALEGVLHVPLWADDFMLLPMNAHELLARIQLATSKRQQGNDWLSSRNIAVNTTTRQVLVGTKQEDIADKLTATELKILSHLLSQPQRIFTRQEIHKACITDMHASERTVDSHISKLRKKIAGTGLRFVPESIRGAGYRLGD